MRKKVLVRLEPSGTRLGNWMFQYAAAKSAEPDAEISFLIENRREWEAVERRRELFGDVPIVDRADPDAEVRTGLYQDAKYVDRETVSEIYRCPPRVEAFLRSRHAALLAKSSLCSIHVRRGDYLDLPHRHPFVGEKYLRDAVASVVRRVPGVEFVVCSDDLPWCRSFFGSSRFRDLTFHFSEDGGVMGDLFLMTKCRHHICSNSTFSWWGAYIGVAAQDDSDGAAEKGVKPIVIFPSHWYGPALRNVDWRGLYFAGCDVIRNGYSFGRWCHARAMMFKNFCGDILRSVGLR